MSVTRFLALAAAACLAGYVYVYATGRADTPVRSDAFSYYVYLPSWLLFHDATLQAAADECCGGAFPFWTAIYRGPRHRWWIDSHPIGEAVMTAPFFVVAHGLTRWSNLTPNGFSFYYVHAAGIAGLCYVVAGLWLLARLLSRHYSENVVYATLATLLAGTSLFHYATFDSTWSHAFSFVLCAALLERLDAWSPGQTRDGAAIGAIAGLLVLVRHTNVTIPIVFAGASVVSWTGVTWRERLRSIAAAALVACAVVMPQLWLYHAASGHWLINSYGDLGFTLASPHVAGVLWSARKGVFFYAPVLLLGVAGIPMFPQGLRRWRAAAAIVLTVHTYVIASWWDWQFGASFGHRGFVDVYPVFALGMAAAFARIAPYRRARVAAFASVVALCALSIFQMLQYWHGVLPHADLTWRGYRDVFLKTW
ncbi:MAG TPA: hypothetical protein VH138_19035 [Vicinamibacterales bacterium]|nr:hypothetical protein [Vicinamibacterales bacterium]